MNVLGIRNIRLLWIGEGISLLGDQFYMIALPWLVLSLTGNVLAVGTVMAMAGILVSSLGGGATHSSLGIAFAFALDSISFIASITMLSLMRIE